MIGDILFHLGFQKAIEYHNLYNGDSPLYLYSFEYKGSRHASQAFGIRSDDHGKLKFNETFKKYAVLVFETAQNN